MTSPQRDRDVANAVVETTKPWDAVAEWRGTDFFVEPRCGTELWNEAVECRSRTELWTPLRTSMRMHMMCVLVPDEMERSAARAKYAQVASVPVCERWRKPQ